VIDPPEGWRYGFPKIIPNDMIIASEELFSKWLVSNGYPEDRLFEALRYSRYWEQNEKNSTNTTEEEDNG
jgi:hypothetical protein